MARSTPSLIVRSMGALSRGLKQQRGNSIAQEASSSSSFQFPSPSSAAHLPSRCRICKLRSAVVSLQPFLSVSSQSLFVSRLSFGAEDPVVLVQDGFDGT